MSAKEFEMWLGELINFSGDDECCEVEDIVTSQRSFEEAGMLTRNKGLVVKTKNGSVFQITIVKAR